MGLKQGQALGCGCVVGAYWCGPHDIYARRKAPTQRWAERDGRFYMRELLPNAHRPMSDFRPIRSEMPGDWEPEGCSCHINPPCSWCVDQPDPDDPSPVSRPEGDGASS